ncbi:uncharacterized protein LOC110983772 [Acanthaster planci]|uniref:Uncharacterized protein LOC110983772 n=1 Tax=Acanthaster planci TaxID=133434 RepID=A0A8B7Z082_ACAPL|nr:uncharacterized protein LOC110983772 [Acanthaster planci]
MAVTRMRMDSTEVNAAVFVRGLLGKVLDDLQAEVDGPSKNDRIKQSIQNISQMYKQGLSRASTNFRSDWNDPSNRCAYVFLYLLQHCHLVYHSIHKSDISKMLSKKKRLKVCCIGGGPGSDVIGLTSFLRENSSLQQSLDCLVLDLYPTWRDTWHLIRRHMPDGLNLSVTYQGCDLVQDSSVGGNVLGFIQQADMLTFVKSFSTVSAFFRADSRRGDLLRSILQEIKPDCFVLFIDNKHLRDKEFQQQFASRAGLKLVFEYRGTQTLPNVGPYTTTIKKYSRLLDFKPLRTCDVLIQVFCKESVGAVSRESQPVSRDSPLPSSSTTTTTSSARRRPAPPPAPSVVRQAAPQRCQYLLQNFFAYERREPEISEPVQPARQGLSSASAGMLLESVFF